jgi:NAD(P)H dehydrogenase (quinone)
MHKTVLIVHAHPEPRSLTRQLAATTRQTLQDLGHHVLESDLYGMRWKAVFDGDDFPQRLDPERLSFIDESGHAFATATQTEDVAREQDKLLSADAVIFQFPLWWFGFPAILKGWVDRIFAYGLAYGYRDAGNRYRYGEGGLAGRRALLSVAVGGPEADYGPRGINGPIEQLLFPITHGTLFFAGMSVLPTFTVYGTGSIDTTGVDAAKRALAQRIVGLFSDEPIPFRKQNGGAYPDRHALAPHVAPGVTGISAHVASDAVATTGIVTLADAPPLRRACDTLARRYPEGHA